VEIRASKGATRYIRKRGAALYVWADDNRMLRHATERPADVPFRRLRAPSFALFLQKGLILGEWIGIERSPLPPWRLLVAFDLMGVTNTPSG
jgi:hypothetical protein